MKKLPGEHAVENGAGNRSTADMGVGFEVTTPSPLEAAIPFALPEGAAHGSSASVRTADALLLVTRIGELESQLEHSERNESEARKGWRESHVRELAMAKQTIRAEIFGAIGLAVGIFGSFVAVWFYFLPALP